MIVATAGHIDHGKTLLVRALTGVDTDRLPEEKARGISIDLGFAHMRLGEGQVASFVDVPGHERFIRNMLAGVCAIDAALLVVAADDGVMPQTLEHVHILDLMDVRRGVAVITKADRVAPARVEAVRCEVAALLASTGLSGFSTLAVSVVSGQGLDELRDWLTRSSGEIRYAVAEGQHFRLAIDRAFSIAGSGTVVTGAVFTGSVAARDKLVISPRGVEVRVRGVQVHGKAAGRAQAGQRCALNLAGADIETVARGDWLLDEHVHGPTQRFDARLKVLTSESDALEHWTSVQVHLGTATAVGRIAMAAEASIAPGQAGVMQIVLDRPLGALHGDRFVIRDQSARRTIGGGVVLDPFPPQRRRGTPARRAELEALTRGTPAEILAGLLDITEGGVDLARFARALNLTAARAAVIHRDANAVVLGKDRPIGVSRAYIDVLHVKVLEALRAFHADRPQAAGMEAAALHRVIALRLPEETFQHVLRDLANKQALVLSNDVARLPGHNLTSNPVDERLWSVVRGALERAGLLAPSVTELATQLKIKEAALRDFLHRKSRTGEKHRCWNNYAGGDLRKQQLTLRGRAIKPDELGCDFGTRAK